MQRHSDPAHAQSHEAQSHDHVFLGDAHEKNERKTWAVIMLCGVMMLVEIVGGSVFGSLALVADGLHMSTHAGAMLIAALAYAYARRHATDNRFVFGTGKLGDLAGFTSAIVLAMIAVLIGYEAIARFRDPVTIEFGEAIPIAVIGLIVNVVSAWLLSGTDHHGHSHGRHDHSRDHHHPHDHEENHAHGHARDALHNYAHGHQHDHGGPDHGGQQHRDPDHGPDFVHGGHGPAAYATTRDNSIRSAYAHVMADAFVSLLAITGLILARVYGWVWMDPLAGIIGALVIANWAVTLIRDTAGVLLDVCPDEVTRDRLRTAIEVDGDRVVDLHLWRLGPGHLAAVLAIVTSEPRDAVFYRARLSSFECLSHLTVEVTRAAAS